MEEVLEEAMVNSLRVYKSCISESYKLEEDEGFLIIKILQENHHGTPGTQDHLIGLPNPKFIPLSLNLIPLFLDDQNILKDNIRSGLAYCDEFKLENTVDQIAQEITCYLRSCFEFNQDVSDNDDSDDTALVFFAQVYMVHASKAYVDAKEKQVFANLAPLNERKEGSCDCVDDCVIEDVNLVEIIDDDYGDEESNMVAEMASSCEVDCKSCSSVYNSISCIDDDDDGYEFDEEDMDIDCECIDNDHDNGNNDNDSITKELRLFLNVNEIVLQEVKPSISIEDTDIEWTSCGDMIIGRNNGDDSTECSICLSEIYGRKLARSKKFPWNPENHSWLVVRLGCGHVFHYSCIFKWLPDKKTCPLCRSSTITDVNYLFRFTSSN